MKGPGLRIKHDPRREWICPETGKTTKVAGNVTAVLSPFSKQEVFMQLNEPVRMARVQISLDEMLGHMDLPPDPREVAAPTQSETTRAEDENLSAWPDESDSTDTSERSERPEE